MKKVSVAVPQGESLQDQLYSLYSTFKEAADS